MTARIAPSIATGPAIRFEDVRLAHPGGVEALAGLSFSVPIGAFGVVLGPSGAGKSTMLRTINGLSRPDSGTIHITGIELDRRSLPALRRRIAMIHQQHGLVGRSSVAANIAAGALASMSSWRALAGAPPRQVRERACRLAAAVGLDATQIGRRVDQLSGGQQQRVGVARAFMMSPTIILADEPVASLDPAIARDILRLLREEARAAGATVLCSLHQIDLARDFADWILAMRAGKAIHAGPASCFWAMPGADLALYGNAA